MIVPCGICLTVIDGKSSSVPCSGVCNKRFYLQCVDMTATILKYLNSVSGLSWKCKECDRNCFPIDHTGLNKFLEGKHTELLNNLNSVFDTLKSDFKKVTEENMQVLRKSESDNVIPPPHSQILKNKTQPAIIVKPKNTVQTATLTKSDIKANISPLESQLSLTKVKDTQSGGVSIGFSSKDEKQRFKERATAKLGVNYDIHEIKGFQPRVKIVGLSQEYPDSGITDFLEHSVKTNSTTFNYLPECRVLKQWPTKKNQKKFQALLQVDQTTYDVVMKAGGVFIGYDY